MTCETDHSTITEIITGTFTDSADEQLVEDLDQVVQELKEHNEKVNLNKS